MAHLSNSVRQTMVTRILITLDTGFWSFLIQDKVDENHSANQNLKSLLICH